MFLFRCRTGAPTLIPMVTVPVVLLGTFGIYGRGGLYHQYAHDVRPVVPRGLS